MYRLLLDWLQPFPLLLVITAVTALWTARRRSSRRRWWIPCGSLALLVVSSMPGFAWLALATLEGQTEPLTTRPSDTEAMVVLGGGMIVSGGKQRTVLPTPSTMYRCLTAKRLVDRASACPLLVSGGAGRFAGIDASEATVMRDFLVALGVPPERILLDERAGSTYENAVNCRRILEPLGIRRILLITQAMHMPRARRCFEAQGFQVTAAACRFQTQDEQPLAGSFVPTPEGAAQTARAAHEWLGILFYRLSGKM